MPSVLIYTRLSTVDLNEATDRQEAACRAYAEARGWVVLDVLTDTAASAYDPRAKRPAFEALFGEAERRTCSGVLVWKFDRLVRRPADFERLWLTAEKSNVFLASVMEPIDTSTPLGVALLRILVALAGLESATTGARVSAVKRRSAERGDHPPVKAYGLTEDWSGEVPEEAAVIREAAARVLNGERIASIARDIQRRGIPAPGGGAFTNATLGRILQNHRLVGDRTHKGVVVAQDCWHAILDRETFARLQMTLARPERVGAPPRHHKRLATGFTHCGLCGHPMATTTRSGVRYYSCPTEPTGCGRCHVRADFLEEWLLDRLADHLVDEGIPPEQGDALTVAAGLRELARDYYVERIIGRDEFLTARSALDRRAEALAQEQQQAPDVRRLLRSTNPRLALGKLDVTRQRALLEDRLARLEVARTVAHNGRFDARRLTCTWNEASRRPNAQRAPSP